jgi:hypothetical protein
MSAADAVRRAEALREASLVRRAIRGARSGTNGALGSLAALDALRRGVASEILLSRRFIESDPASAATASRLAASRGARLTMVTGLAEFELDLIGRGIGALLRHAPSTHRADNRPAE